MGEGKRRMIRSLRCVAIVLAASTRVAADATPSAAILAAECYASGGDFRLCRSLEQLARTSAGPCRFLGLGDGSCTTLDGKAIAPSHVAAYQGTWTHRAHTLQRRLDDDVALELGLIPGTHNSFNSAVYYPTVSGLDHNQVYSLSDQLDMDIRGLELDVHWMPSSYADAADGGFAPILCHGQDEVVAGDLHVHPGCTIERHLRDGLSEIRTWLDAHPDEFLLLYLENHLDGEAGHAAAARTIAAELGDLVLQTPPGAPCAPMPASASRAELRVGGARVLIVGNCGPGDWGRWVHERDQTNLWRESLAKPPADSSGCSALHENGGANDYDTHFIRVYEDSTWLSASVNGSADPLTLDDTLALVRCGVNLTGFDQLTPEDLRLKALVWSWAEGEPSSAGDCAKTAQDHRFHAAACSSTLRYACRSSSGAWSVTGAAGFWNDGFSTCDGEFPGSQFATPRTGYENELVARAREGAGALEAWVNYAASGGWTPNLPPGTTP